MAYITADKDIQVKNKQTGQTYTLSKGSQYETNTYDVLGGAPATGNDSRMIRVDGTLQRPNTPPPVADTRSLVTTNNIPVQYQTPEVMNYVKSLGGDTRSLPGTPVPGAVPSPYQAPANSSQNPAETFNTLLTDMLTKAKGVGTADLLKRKRALQRASLSRTSEITPSELRTLSPAQQAAIRDGNTKVLSSEIDENEYQIKKAEQAIENFEKVYTEAKKFGEEFADKMVAPDSVIQSYKMAIEANPDMMSTILSGVNDKTRQKVIGSLDYNKLKDVPKTTGGGGSNSSSTPKGTIVSGKFTVTPEIQSELIAFLENGGEWNGVNYNGRGPDKYIDPYAYMAAFDYWVREGGNANDFVKEYPPAKFVNPAASSILPTFLRNTAKATTTTTPTTSSTPWGSQ